MHSALDFGFPATFPVKSSFVGGHVIPSHGFGSRLRFCSLPLSSSIKVKSLFHFLLCFDFVPFFQLDFCLIHMDDYEIS